MPMEIECLECAIEEEVAFPITERDFACPVLLKGRRLDAVEPIRRGPMHSFFCNEARQSEA